MKNSINTKPKTYHWLALSRTHEYLWRSRQYYCTSKNAANGVESKSIFLKLIKPTTEQQLKSIDLLFGGGAQDHEQEIVMKDLYKKRCSHQKLWIENDIPALFVCGAPQLMGKSYEPSVGKKIEGLGIFDMESIHPGKDKPRLIGNVIAKTLETHS